MNEMLLLSIILIPAVLGILLLAIPTKIRYLRELAGLVVAGLLVYFSFFLWDKKIDLVIPWAGFGIDFQLRLYSFSQFIMAAITVFVLIMFLYSIKFMADRPKNNQFCGFLFLAEAMAVGAVLANNLIIMLFFWEGLLISLFGMIYLGREQAYKTAVKMFIIIGLSDLCLLLGITMVGIQAKTLVMSDIHLSTTGLNGVAFILMLIGAMAKAGAMPFHTWIPDAAVDAPLPFMALFPGALEKLLGIYLVARIALDFFQPNVGMRILVMSIGAITIILAVMMALIQKDFKKLLSYHAISQVGYMILGIGTGIPLAVAGGLFHMINNAIFKSCLFLTGGAVEKQAGTTDLNRLGGLGRQMPVTFGCFLIAALSISGVPLFNGFVSKEMIFEGTLETGYLIFFIVAVVGAIFTAASFLKLGHAVFFGKPSSELQEVSEAHWSMLVPMAALAWGCIMFGLRSDIALKYLIKPAFAGLSKVEYFKFHLNSPLFWVSVVVLTIAVLNHIHGVKATGKGVGASEHIHHAPGLVKVYDLAEKRVFDPYVQGRTAVGYVALGLFWIDRGVDWFYQKLVPTVADLIASVRRIHNGLFANYLSWSLGGMVLVVLYLIWFMK
jgi:formate hydrogenlyase subunit 3/multisubunit Na+/H+ antiporter MnhD subunit